MRKIGCFALLLLISGCKSASVSQNQCLAGDWQTLGYQDGRNGSPSTRLLQHQDACVEHGVIPDRALYLAGWDEGVAEYCQPDHGFSLGERGGRYFNVCPAYLAPEFLDAYRSGRALHDARSEVRALENRLASGEQRLKAIRTELVNATTDQLDPDLTAEQRVKLVTYMHELMEEQRELQDEMPRIARELDHKVRALDSLRQSLAGAYI